MTSPTGQFILVAVIVFATSAALAQRGMGGGRGMGERGGGIGSPPRCPPHVTFEMCWNRCIALSGTARTDMMRCDKRCSAMGCQDAKELQPIWSR